MKPLTEKQKQKARIAIAKDVINHLPDLNVTHGSYFDSTTRLPKTGDARNYIDKLRKCEVCVLGCMMVSFIDKYNSVKMEDFTHDFLHWAIIKCKLGEIFADFQLDDIERHFEDFGWSIKDIMENIITNEGTFVGR